MFSDPADLIGTGNYVVYNGPANSVLVSGLSASTTYYFAVYEYSNTEYCYKNSWFGRKPGYHRLL